MREEGGGRGTEKIVPKYVCRQACMLDVCVQVQAISSTGGRGEEAEEEMREKERGEREMGGRRRRASKRRAGGARTLLGVWKVLRDAPALCHLPKRKNVVDATGGTGQRALQEPVLPLHSVLPPGGQGTHCSNFSGGGRGCAVLSLPQGGRERRWGWGTVRVCTRFYSVASLCAYSMYVQESIYSS